MTAYAAGPLPQELWPGSHKRWGVRSPDGKWLREAPSGKAYSFVTPRLAQSYADQCNAGHSSRNNRQEGTPRPREMR